MVALSVVTTSGACGGSPGWRGTSEAVAENFTKIAKVEVMTSMTVEEVLWPVDPVQAYQTPGLEQRRAFADLMDMLSSQDLGSELEDAQLLEPLAHKAGFEVHRWTIGAEQFVALIEKSGAERGSGAYIFRLHPRIGPATAPRRSIILQAPHVLHDTGTGRLALTIFFDTRLPPPQRPWALFVNNAHRYLDEKGRTKEQDYNPSDACHSTEHLFNDATEAATKSGPVVVYQFHGFKDKKFPASIVVSSSDPLSSTIASTVVAKRLGKVYDELGYATFRYPEDTGRLGATKNIQGRILRSKEDAHFIHIELSPEIRKRANRDRSLVAKMGSVVLRPLDGAPGLGGDPPEDSGAPVDGGVAETSKGEEAGPSGGGANPKKDEPPDGGAAPLSDRGSETP
jgi:hypothetical protein